MKTYEKPAAALVDFSLTEQLNTGDVNTSGFVGEWNGNFAWNEE